MFCEHRRRSDHGNNPVGWQVCTHSTQERYIMILAKDLSLSSWNMFLLVTIILLLKVFISKLTRIARTIPFHRLAKSKRLEFSQQDSIPISDRYTSFYLFFLFFLFFSFSFFLSFKFFFKQGFSQIVEFWSS